MKVTLAYSQELEDKAVDSSMPEPASDRERPSLHTLSKMHTAVGPNGTYQHLSWETSCRWLRRAGKLPKDRKELVIEQKKLTMTLPLLSMIIRH